MDKLTDKNRRFSKWAPPPRALDPFDGVLLVDKPPGPTSHDIVAAIRKRFKIKKVGHGGTLDPQATGLLVILLGTGTKLADRFIHADKIYMGTLCLGTATDSQDAQGTVVRQADYSAVTEEQVKAEMRKLTGDILQTPPMVSAIKVDGVPLYKRARKGETVERQPRLIHVYEFSLLKFYPPRADFLLRCTKGTYARTLCADIGEALGCGAHLEKLRRMESGENRVEDALSANDILKMTREELLARIIPLQKFSGVDHRPATSTTLK